MRYLLILLSLALLTSCSITKQCNNCLKKCQAVSIKDSTHVTEKDSTVLRDSIVYIPRDSFQIVLKDSVPCKDFKATGSDKKGNRVIVYVHDGIMTVDAQCEDAKVKLQWFEKHYSKIISNYHSESRIITVKKKDSWFNHFQTWIALGLIAYFLFTGIIRRLGYKLTFTIIPPFVGLVKRSG